MTRQQLISQCKNLVCISLAGFLLAGCEPIVPSLEVPTEEIFADYTVDAYESAPSIGTAWFYTAKNTANEPLDDIGILKRATIELSDGEICDVSHEGSTYSMKTYKDQTLELKQDPRYWFLFSTSITWYAISELSIHAMGERMSTPLPPLAVGDEVQFSFRRASGEELFSSAIIDEYPVITAPSNGFSVEPGEDAFTVSWNSLPNTDVPTQLMVAVRCSSQTTPTGDEFIDLAALTYDAEHKRIGSLDVSVLDGETSYVVTRSELMKNVTVPSGLTECVGGVSIAYNSRYELAPEFKGGRVEVTHNSRKVAFRLKL